MWLTTRRRRGKTPTCQPFYSATASGAAAQYLSQPPTHLNLRSPRLTWPRPRSGRRSPRLALGELPLAVRG